jgi:hypothetical protein
MRPVTIFCDIDGTLVEHLDATVTAHPSHEPNILSGTLEKLLEWDKKGYRIILTTGRKESMRSVTKKQLSKLGIFYDQLIMGIGGGHRVLINDSKNEEITATAFVVKRNEEGIKNIEI